jgi:hypothetical protein
MLVLLIEGCSLQAKKKMAIQKILKYFIGIKVIKNAVPTYIGTALNYVIIKF